MLSNGGEGKLVLLVLVVVVVSAMAVVMATRDVTKPRKIRIRRMRIS